MYVTVVDNILPVYGSRNCSVWLWDVHWQGTL